MCMEIKLIWYLPYFENTLAWPSHTQVINILVFLYFLLYCSCLIDNSSVNSKTPCLFFFLVEENACFKRCPNISHFNFVVIPLVFVNKHDRQVRTSHRLWLFTLRVKATFPQWIDSVSGPICRRCFDRRGLNWLMGKGMRGQRSRHARFKMRLVEPEASERQKATLTNIHTKKNISIK